MPSPFDTYFIGLYTDPVDRGFVTNSNIGYLGFVALGAFGVLSIGALSTTAVTVATDVGVTTASGTTYYGISLEMAEALDAGGAFTSTLESDALANAEFLAGTTAGVAGPAMVVVDLSLSAVQSGVDAAAVAAMGAYMESGGSGGGWVDPVPDDLN